MHDSLSDTRANHTGSEPNINGPLPRLVNHLQSKLPVKPLQALGLRAGQGLADISQRMRPVRQRRRRRSELDRNSPVQFKPTTTLRTRSHRQVRETGAISRCPPPVVKLGSDSWRHLELNDLRWLGAGPCQRVVEPDRR